MFSGIGLAIFFPAVFWWHHICHIHGCWRWGHPDPDHGHPACRRHQPRLERDLIRQDVAELAELQPGPDAVRLAQHIQARL